MEIVQEGQLLIINRHKLCNCFSTEGSIVQVIEIDVEKASRVYPEMNDMIFQAASLRKRRPQRCFYIRPGSNFSIGLPEFKCGRKPGKSAERSGRLHSFSFVSGIYDFQ